MKVRMGGDARGRPSYAGTSTSPASACRPVSAPGLASATRRQARGDRRPRPRDAPCARRSPRRLGATSPEPSRRAASSWTPDGTVVGEGPTASPGPRTPRSTPWPRRGAPGRGATAVVTLEPCNHTGRTGPCTAALWPPASPRRVRRRRPEPRRRRAAPPRLRAAGVEVEVGLLADEAARAQRSPGPFAVTHRAPLRHLEVRRHARRPDRRRRRHEPLDHRRRGPGRRPRPARPCRRHHRRDRHRAGRRPAPDRRRDGPSAARDRQPLRVVVGLGGRPRRTPRCSTTRRAALLRHARTTPREACSPCSAGRGVRHVLLEGGPTLAGAFLARRARRRGRRRTSRPPLLGAGPAGPRRPRACRRIAEAFASTGRRDRPSAPTCGSTPGAPGPRGGLSVHRHRRGARRGRGGRAAGRRRADADPRPARHRRRGARRLDRRQRRLPHRRRATPTARSPPTSCRRRSTGPRLGALVAGRRGQPRARRVTLDDAARRPPRAGPRRRHRHDPRPHAGRALGDRPRSRCPTTSAATSSRRARSPSTASP